MMKECNFLAFNYYLIKFYEQDSCNASNGAYLTAISIVSYQFWLHSNMIEDTAVPCPYNVILGRDTALPYPNFCKGYQTTLRARYNELKNIDREK